MEFRRISLFGGLASMVFLSFGLRDVSAQNTAESFTVSPFIGGYGFDENKYLDNGLNFGLKLGYNFDENIGIEVSADYVDTDVEAYSDETMGKSNLGELGAESYSVNMLYHFVPEEKLVPFVEAGVGLLSIDADGRDTENDFVMSYGAGLKYFVTELVALRGDIRHSVDFGDDVDNSLSYNAGITFSFGGVSRSTSGDTSSAEARADNDSDGDGVTDDKDKCPNTPKGAVVDESGCWVIKLDSVYFDFDKSKIKPEFYSVLNDAMKIIQQHPEMKVEIQGHTDSIGTQQYNQGLSNRRAKAVMDYFVSKGIAKERLSAKGFWFSQPATTNATKEGRAKNRRVQLNPVVLQLNVAN